MPIEAIATKTDDYEAASAARAIYRAVPGSCPSFSDALNASTSISSGSANLDAIFEEAGRLYNLSPNLLKAVARVESNFNPNALSRAGAMGIMQLMPGTAAGLGVTNAYDPVQNIMGGARYLRQMLDRFDGNLRAALSAYNAGPGRVSSNGGEPLPFTENYVSRVLSYYSGGNIAAGTVKYGNSYDSLRSSGETGDQFDFFGLSGSLNQMILLKVIEMQMNSSSDNDGNTHRVP